MEIFYVPINIEAQRRVCKKGICFKQKHMFVIMYTFNVDPEAVDELIRNIDRDLGFGFNQIPLLMMPDVSTIKKKAKASGK